MAGNCEKMLDYYPLLIESAIDFKIESRKILAQHNSKSNISTPLPVKSPSHQNIVVSIATAYSIQGKIEIDSKRKCDTN